MNEQFDASKAPLLAHLRELRKRIFKSALGIVAFAVIGWLFYNQIILQLATPMCGESQELQSLEQCTSLYVSGVLGPLNLQIKVALLVGIILSAPVWLFQIWAFVLPGLKRREKNSRIRLLRWSDSIFCCRGDSWILHTASRNKGFAWFYSRQFSKPYKV